MNRTLLAVLVLLGLGIKALERLAGAAGSILGLSRNPTPVTGTQIPPEDQKEIDDLKERFRKLTWYLLTLTLFSLGVLTVLVSSFPSSPYVWVGIVACIAAGTMGSTVAALQSSQERRANGWEVGSGKKYPEPTPGDKFNPGMVPQFYTRPLLGSVIGGVFYLGGPGVLGWDQEDLRTLAFWSFVVGIMAKTFIGMLKDLFKKLGQ